MQSRYYDPDVGRFINADSLISTGQGLLGNNMLAYCNNNPGNHKDNTGRSPDRMPWSEFFEELGEKIRDRCLELHYARNQQNKQPRADELMGIVNGNSSEWKPVDDKYNRYHRFTEGSQGQEAQYNKKYMSHDKQYEVIICYHEVYVPTPYIVTDPINQGTYNYGTNPVTHALLDVLPYWLWGNGYNDTTSDRDRMLGRG